MKNGRTACHFGVHDEVPDTLICDMRTVEWEYREGQRMTSTPTNQRPERPE